MSKRSKRIKYTELTKMYSKWLFNYVDRFYWGEFDERDLCPKFVNTKAERARGYYPLKLTKTHIQEHLQGTKKVNILYYTTRAAATTALLMIDIDAHRGQQNAKDVAEWIVNTYFPDAYFEPSTGGLGIHIYLLVEIKKNNKHMTRSLFNAYMKDFGDKLRYLVDNEFMAEIFPTANVCGIHGTVTYRTQEGDGDKWIIHNGKLGKMPKPQTKEDVEKLVNMPVYKLWDLAKVVTEAEARRFEKENVGWGLVCKKYPQERRKAKKPRNIRKIQVDPDNLAESLWDNDPRKRAFSVVIYLWQRTGKEPSETEALDLYEELGLHTGRDINNRRLKRIRDAIVKVGKEYDPDKYSVDGKAFDLDSYKPKTFIPVLQSKLSDEDLQNTGYKGIITYTDLDLCASIIMDKILTSSIGDEGLFCSVSSTLIARIFRQARERGVVKSKDPKKIPFMKDLLEKAGIFDIDRSWVYQGDLYKKNGDVITDALGRKNRGNIFRPTSQNPKYEEFLKVEAEHFAKIKNKSA